MQQGKKETVLHERLNPDTTHPVIVMIA